MELAQKFFVVWAILSWFIPFLCALAMIMNGRAAVAKAFLWASAIAPVLALVGLAGLLVGRCGW